MPVLVVPRVAVRAPVAWWVMPVSVGPAEPVAMVDQGPMRRQVRRDTRVALVAPVVRAVPPGPVACGAMAVRVA